MIKFTSSSKLILLYFLSICLSYIIFVSLEMRINWSSNIQGDFIIDGFYYAKIGYENKINSFHDVINNQLNPQSAGVVLINTIYANVIPLYLYPILNISILFLICFKFYRVKSSLVFALSIIIFMPYLILVSKEFLITVGLLLFLTPKRSEKILGFVLVFLGRPESGIILALAVLAYLTYERRSKLFFWSLCGVLFLIYLDLRTDIYNYSLAFQGTTLHSSYSCTFPVFETCLSELGTMEYVFFNRVMIGILLPIKWMFDIVYVQSIFSIQYLMGAVFLLLFIMCSKYPKKIITQQPILIIFCVVNMLLYLAILFIAPSRPILFHTYLLMVFSVLEAKNLPWELRND